MVDNHWSIFYYNYMKSLQECSKEFLLLIKSYMTKSEIAIDYNTYELKDSRHSKKLIVQYINSFDYVNGSFAVYVKYNIGDYGYATDLLTINSAQWIKKYEDKLYDNNMLVHDWAETIKEWKRLTDIFQPDLYEKNLKTFIKLHEMEEDFY